MAYLQQFLFLHSKIERMARVLTGIQSTGVPHLGNILGAIIPAIELSKNLLMRVCYLLQTYTL